jgi:hypothetical protein
MLTISVQTGVAKISAALPIAQISTAWLEQIRRQF